MRNALRAVLAVLVGIAVGASAGAVVLGLPVYLSDATGFLGPDREWAGIAAVVGSACGAVMGALIGIINVLSKAGKVVGAIVGACVGVAVLVILLTEGATPSDTEIFTAGLLSVPVGAVIGFVVALFGRRGWPAESIAEEAHGSL